MSAHGSLYTLDVTHGSELSYAGPWTATGSMLIAYVTGFVVASHSVPCALLHSAFLFSTCSVFGQAVREPSRLNAQADSGHAC